MEPIHEETILFTALLALVGWVLYLFFRRYQVRAQARLQRNEAVNKLLEKFSSAQEFVDFLETEKGRKFFDDPLPDRVHPMRRVFTSIQAAILSIFLSGAFFIHAHLLVQENDLNWIRHRNEDLFHGFLLLGVGLSLIVFALISQWLAAKWGILEGHATTDNHTK